MIALAKEIIIIQIILIIAKYSLLLQGLNILVFKAILPSQNGHFINGNTIITHHSYVAIFIHKLSFAFESLLEFIDTLSNSHL